MLRENFGSGILKSVVALRANRGRLRGTVKALALTMVFVVGAWTAHAADPVVKISTRPLTPQEKKSYPAGTQLAGGVQNVGIGQPVYLEALVTKGTAVSNVNWVLAGRPIGSLAAIQNSPLTNNTYDVGDQLAFDVAGRAMLVPDVMGSSLKGDYKVVANVILPTKTISVTNMVYGSKYAGMYGDEGFGCELCHSDKIPEFALTQHSDAFKRKINGEAGAGFKGSCVSCHVLGYDTAPAAVNAGFDDVALGAWTFPTNLGLPSATNNWNAMPTALQAKSNIQCESCHGPGYRHMLSGGKTEMIGISLSAGNCGQCHDSMTKHSKNFEWSQALHASGQVFRTGSCAPCHSAKGFIDTNDPGIDFDGDTVVTRGTTKEGITCVACHDPHGPGMGVHQLRVVDDVTLLNGFKIPKGGDGILCMACHHDRRDAETYVLSSRSGPHYGTQADMLFGKNAIQYGIQMPSSRHWDVVEDSCVQCHMQESPTGPAQSKVGGHTFTLSWNADTPEFEDDDVHLTETCSGCHGEIENFNFGGEDFDRDGSVEGVQKEIKDMLSQLSYLLPPAGTPYVSNALIHATSTADLGKRKAYYNYSFVKYDGSYGVHNPKFAAALLRASIDDMTGGIDVDRDGLLDSWEIFHFGSITAQSGSGDADNDGLTNAQEMALGTNPRAADTDNDGIWDLAELQAGSDPLKAGSYPGTNMVYVLPAIEIGYVPGSTNGTIQFQSISTLGGQGTWTNLGPSLVSSNAWFYQLMSTRDATQKFFRVITTP